jgi:hypothetical protein
MCCFFTALVFFGPRLGFLVYWLLAPIRVNAAFAAFNLPWLVGLASLIFAPWTALMYVRSPAERLGLTSARIMADLASYLGGYHNRQAVPGYPVSAP